MNDTVSCVLPLSFVICVCTLFAIEIDPVKLQARWETATVKGQYSRSMKIWLFGLCVCSLKRRDKQTSRKTVA